VSISCGSPSLLRIIPSSARMALGKLISLSTVCSRSVTTITSSSSTTRETILSSMQPGHDECEPFRPGCGAHSTTTGRKTGGFSLSCMRMWDRLRTSAAGLWSRFTRRATGLLSWMKPGLFQTHVPQVSGCSHYWIASGFGVVVVVSASLRRRRHRDGCLPRSMTSASLRGAQESGTTEPIRG
jgi:hypothetical protein